MNTSMYTPQQLQKEARAMVKGRGRYTRHWIELHDKCGDTVRAILAVEYQLKDGFLAQTSEVL